jgi:hypothetical protein
VEECHLAIDDRILFPLDRPPGEGHLRFDDFLEQRVFRSFLPGDVVEDFELPL